MSSERTPPSQLTSGQTIKRQPQCGVRITELIHSDKAFKCNATAQLLSTLTPGSLVILTIGGTMLMLRWLLPRRHIGKVKTAL